MLCFARGMSETPSCIVKPGQLCPCEIESRQHLWDVRGSGNSRKIHHVSQGHIYQSAERDFVQREPPLEQLKHAVSAIPQLLANFVSQNKYLIRSDFICDTTVYVFSVAIRTFWNLICVQLADAVPGQMLEEWSHFSLLTMLARIFRSGHVNACANKFVSIHSDIRIF